MFDLLSKLFEIVAAPVDVEKRMWDYYRKIVNTKLTVSTWPTEPYFKFWMLTNGDIIPVKHTHKDTVSKAGIKVGDLEAEGAVAGSIMGKELNVDGSKTITPKQIASLRNLCIEHDIDTLIDYIGRHNYSTPVKSPKEAAYYLEYGKEEWESKNKADLLEQLLNSATATDMGRKREEDPNA